MGHETPIAAKVASQFEVEPQGLALVAQGGGSLQALVVQVVAPSPEGEGENAGHRRAAVRQDQSLGEDLFCGQVAAARGRPPQGSAEGRQLTPEPLFLRIAMGWSRRRQQGSQGVCLGMGKVRAVDSRDTVALGDGQAGGLHRFQLAVRRSEAHSARARERADTPAGPVGPEPPKKLPTSAARHQVVEHESSLLD